MLGPVPSFETSLDLLGREAMLDAAVVDVDLGGERADPVADALLVRGVPFVFTTGYDRASLVERHAAVRRLEKPVEATIVLRESERLLATK